MEETRIVPVINDDSSKYKGDTSLVEIETLFTDELLEKFAAYLQVSEQSLKTYGAALRKFYAYLKEYGISSPTRYDIYNYVKYLENEGLSLSTRQVYTTTIKLFFSWCAYEGLYRDITFHLKSVPVPKRHKRDFFSKKQLREIEEIAFSEKNSEIELRNRAIFLLLAQCGLRGIEVVRANVGDYRREWAA